MARTCFSNEFLLIGRLLGICELSYFKLLRQVNFNFFHQLLNPHFARSVFHQIKHFSFKYFHFSLDECSASFFKNIEILTKKKIVWFPGKFKNAKVSSIFKKMIGNFCIFFAGENSNCFFFSVNFFRQNLNTIF